MADKKISALTAATTPLAGTEVLPIVQGGSTVKVAVSNLTAGRNVSVKELSITDFTAGSVVFTGAAGLCEQDNANLFWDNANNRLGIGTSTPATSVNIYNGGSGLGNVVSATIANTDGSAGSQALKIGSYQTGGSVVSGVQVRASYNYGGSAGTSLSLDYCTGGGTITEGFRLDTSGNATVSTGNLVIGTAAKGIDFSANTASAGMTSELLNWYEEGAWTPNQGAGLTVVGSFSSTGTYTRIGRQVTVRGTLTGSTSVACAAVGIMSSNLPFASATDTPGNYFNGSVTAGGQIDASSNSTFAVGAIPATNTIYFSVTYFV